MLFICPIYKRISIYINKGSHILISKIKKIQVKDINRRIFTMFLCMIVCTSYAQKKNAVLQIPFGKNNIITYDLHKNIYTISFAGNVSINNATTASKGLMGDRSGRFKYSAYTRTAFADKLGKGYKYVIVSKAPQDLQFEQVFYVYPDKNYFLIQSIVKGENAENNYLSPLSDARVILDKSGDNRALFVPFDNDMWVRYNAVVLDSAHFTSSEATAVYNSESNHGIVIGSLEHEVWKSGIRVNTKGNNSLNLTAFAGFSDSIITHDKLPHGFVIDKDSICASPKFMVGYFSDWREGMDVYGRNNRLMEPPAIFNWSSPTPIGWNSWGVLQDKLTLTKAKGVIDFFADSCKGFRTSNHTLFIDLDAFWDSMNHGGIDSNTDSLKAFVAYCNSHGFRPGIYWTPFTDWGKSDRKVEGSDYPYPECWTKINGKPIDIDGGRAMDPTHPATKQRIVHYINAFKRLGFKMIKIDFLAHGTLQADSYYDKNMHTGMQAFAEGMEYLDKQIGNSMLVYAAISPNMATARYVHMRRIACDAFKRIDETAYTLNSTTYGWWLSKMYNYMDADHVVFDDVTDGENRARLAAAIVTGSLITGDDYSLNGKWKATAKRLLQNKDILAIVQYDGKSFTPVESNTGKDASRIFVKTIGKDVYVAVFNYGDKETNIQLANYKELKKLSDKTYDIFHHQTINMDNEKNITIPGKDAAIYKFIQTGK